MVSDKSLINTGKSLRRQNIFKYTQKRKNKVLIHLQSDFTFRYKAEVYSIKYSAWKGVCGGCFTGIA